MVWAQERYLFAFSSRKFTPAAAVRQYYWVGDRRIRKEVLTRHRMMAAWTKVAVGRKW